MFLIRLVLCLQGQVHSAALAQGACPHAASWAPACVVVGAAAQVDITGFQGGDAVACSRVDSGPLSTSWTCVGTSLHPQCSQASRKVKDRKGENEGT